VSVDVGGAYAVTCSDDLTSRVWDLDNGVCLSVLKVTIKLYFSKARRFAVILAYFVPSSGSWCLDKRCSHHQRRNSRCDCVGGRDGDPLELKDR